MHFKRSISFRLKGRTRSDGTALIMVRATWCGYRHEFSSTHFISPAQWNTAVQKAVGGTNSEGVPVSKINSDLATLRGYLEEIFNRYEFINKEPPTVNELKILFEDMTGRASIEEVGEALFVDTLTAFDRFLSANSPTWEHSTLVGYQAIKTHVNELFGTMDIEEVAASDVDKFQSYLLNKGCKNTYTRRATNKFKTFLRWCSRSGLYRGVAHEAPQTKLKGVNNKEVIVLTPQELEKIINATFTEKQRYLERVRDVLLFACFTGLRYSDIQTLTPANIHGSMLDLVTKKTSDHLTIDLNKMALEIIDKYKDEQEDGKLLPTISNQRANQYLKELGQLLGLDTPTQITYYNKDGRQVETLPKHELITTHIGRRTFISNALSLGVPVTTVMAWTGHKDYQVMKPYIKLIDKAKRKQMGLLDDFVDKLKDK